MSDQPPCLCWGLPPPGLKTLTVRISPREDTRPHSQTECSGGLPADASQRQCLKKPLEKKVIYSAIRYSLDAIMAFYKVVYNASCSCKKIYYSDPGRHINPCKVQVFLFKKWFNSSYLLLLVIPGRLNLKICPSSWVQDSILLRPRTTPTPIPHSTIRAPSSGKAE